MQAVDLVECELPRCFQQPEDGYLGEDKTWRDRELSQSDCLRERVCVESSLSFYLYHDVCVGRIGSLCQSSQYRGLR